MSVCSVVVVSPVVSVETGIVAVAVVGVIVTNNDDLDGGIEANCRDVDVAEDREGGILWDNNRWLI